MGVSNELDLTESFLENRFQRPALNAGFNNYHTISVHDQVHVPKFWSIWCMWVYTEQYIPNVIPKGMSSGEVWGGGCNLPPHTHTHTTHTVFWNLSVFWQNMSVKFPNQMLLVNLEHFIIKMKCRILLISSPAEIKLSPVMTAFKEVI